MSKISVFGSSGFVGKRFTELYPDETIKVKREENKAPTDNLLYLISTVDNYNIHSDLHVDISTNLSKLMDVIKANKNENLVFNFVSSWFVYGQNPNIPFNEEDTICKPTGFYSITKRCAEEMLICFCNTFNIRYRIFRLANVLGEGDKKISRKKNALQFLVNEAVHDRDLHLYYGGEVLRDYIYIDDVCSAIKLCMDTAPTNQIINIGSGRPSKFLDIIEKTLEKSKSKSRIIDIQPTVFHNIVQTKHSYLDIKKLKSYGFKQKYSMDDIIDKLVDYYKKYRLNYIMIKEKKVWYAPNKFESYGEEEIKAVEECLRDGWIAGFGKRSKEFERRVSEVFGKKHGVFVNSGSSACLLAIASLDLPKGSKIITPACTFSTTLAPIIQLGLQPVFVDVNLTSYVPDVDDVIEAVTDEVKAVMLPNLIGNKPNWKEIKSRLQSIDRDDIILIEDSADTITHTIESDIATTSFYASHVITAGGAGGMVMFNDQKYVDKCLQYRDWGRIGDNSEDMSDRFAHDIDGIPYDYKFLYGVLGYNMKSSEMNAAFGLAQLDKFEMFAKKRRDNIERYIENLQDVKEILLPDDSIKPNWLAVPLQIDDRYGLLHHLEENNIQTRVTFAGNVTRHPIYREYLNEYKNSDIIMKNAFLLGAHHGMDIDDVDYVCDKIKEYIK